MTCSILSGKVAYLIQFILALVAILSLYLKYRCEHNKRPLNVWLKDISKLIMGAVVEHLLNLCLAAYFTLSSDQCVTYLVSFVTQSFLGLFLCYILHKLILYNTRKCGLHLAESGRYDSNGAWVAQIILWSIVVLASHLTLFFALVLPLSTYLVAAADWFLNQVVGSNRTSDSTNSTNSTKELIIVMLLIPLVLDVWQFLVQDIFLKFSGTHDTNRTREAAAAVDINIVA